MSIASLIAAIPAGAFAVAAAGFGAGLATRRASAGRMALGVIAAGLCIGLVGAGVWMLGRIGPFGLWEACLAAGAIAAGTRAGIAAAAVQGGRPAFERAFSWIVIAVVAVAGMYILNGRVAAIARQLGVGEGARYTPEANKACPDNLRSLYNAFRMYAEDYDALPPAAGWMDNEDIASKVTRDEWLHCPAVSSRHDNRYGYAYNSQVAGRALHGKPLSVLPGAGSTPLLYDSSDLARSAADPVSSLPTPGRHDGRDNVLYCDGHVALVDPTRVQTGKLK